MTVDHHPDPGIANGNGDPEAVAKWERIAVGKLLLAADPSDLIGELRPGDFSSIGHEALYAAVQVHAGKPNGQVAILSEVIGDRRTKPLGDPAAYLSRCCAVAATAVGDFRFYAQRIRDAAAYRTAQQQFERVRQALQLGDMAQIRQAFDEGAAAVGQPATTIEGNGVQLRAASTFAMTGVKWLYQGRIPAGMVTILAGREGIGKSTVSLDIAARLTRGTLPGRYEGRPQNVILCATEDSWEHTIVPRLRAVGADLDRVFHIAVQVDGGNFRAISAPGDIHAIERAIDEIRPALMVIDPLMAVIDGKIDTHVQQQVQQGLDPLVKLAERVMMAVLGLIHVNKSTTQDALNSVMGSKAFTTLPRSVLYCIADPDDEGTYLFTHEKCNVGPKLNSILYRLTSVRFELDPATIEPGDQAHILTSKVKWGGEDERKAADILAAIAAGRGTGDLRKNLQAFIDAQPRKVAAAELVAEFEDVSVTRQMIDQTLKRMVKANSIDRPSRGFYQSMKSAKQP